MTLTLPRTELFDLSVPLLIAPDAPKVVPEKPSSVTGPDVTVTLPGMQGKLRYVYLMKDPPKSVEDTSILPHSPQDLALVGAAVADAIERIQLDHREVIRAMKVVCDEQGNRCSR